MGQFGEFGGDNIWENYGHEFLKFSQSNRSSGSNGPGWLTFCLCPHFFEGVCFGRNYTDIFGPISYNLASWTHHFSETSEI